MWLALCDTRDAAALWAIAGLRRRGLSPLIAVTPGALVLSRRLAHEIRDGRAHSRFTLPDGREVACDDVCGVLNRWRALPLEHLAGATTEDSRYAVQEIHAIVLSLLAGFGERAINAPTPQGLAGHERAPAEWTLLAGRAGLPTLPFRMTSDAPPSLIAGGQVASVVVLDDDVHLAAARLRLPTDLHPACVALRRLAGVRVLGVDLHRGSDDTWWFRGATPVPDWRIGGEPLLDGLLAALTGTSS